MGDQVIGLLGHIGVAMGRKGAATLPGARLSSSFAQFVGNQPINESIYEPAVQ